MDTNMRVYTDTIQSEAAKIMLKVEFEQKSRQLAQLFKEINGIVGGFGLYDDHINRDGIMIQIQINSLLDISQRPTITKRGRADAPFELSTNVGGVKYFTVLLPGEWLKWANDNHICPECGKDFAEYMDYDQDVEKMFFGCRDCRNGEATGRAV